MTNLLPFKPRKQTGGGLPPLRNGHHSYGGGDGGPPVWGLPEAAPAGMLSRTSMRLAGADPDLVPPEERLEYVAGGVMVAAVAAMAAVGMYFAATTAFGLDDNAARAVAAGWGLVVGSLDRWLLGTPKDPDASRAASLVQAGVRIVMALALAVVISEFLVLRIYNAEIDAHLEAEAAAAAAAAERTAGELVADRQAAIHGAREAADAKVADARATIQAAEQELAAACAAAPGCVPDRPSSYPPAAARANHNAARGNRLLEQAQAEARAAHERLDAEAGSLTAEADEERRRLVDAARKRTGLLAREEALGAITAASPELGMRRWAITVFLVAFDLLVVALKVLRRPTEYDRLVLERVARRGEVEQARIRVAGNAALAGAAAAGESVEADAKAARAWLTETPQRSKKTYSRSVRKPPLISSENAGQSGSLTNNGQGGRPAKETPRAWDTYRDVDPPPGGWNSVSLGEAARVSRQTAYLVLREVLTKLNSRRAEGWAAEELAEAGKVTVEFADSFLEGAR